MDALNRAAEERQAARDDLDRMPAAHVLSHADVAMMINELDDVGAALDQADPAGLEELYTTFRLAMVYDANEKIIDMTIRSSRWG